MGNKRQIADLQAILKSLVDQKTGFVGCILAMIDHLSSFTVQKQRKASTF